MATHVLDLQVGLFHHRQARVSFAGLRPAGGRLVALGAAKKICECPLAWTPVLRHNLAIRRGRSRLVQVDCSGGARAASRGPVYVGASHAGRVLAETRRRSHRMGGS